jgi:hypothetical protein
MTDMKNPMDAMGIWHNRKQALLYVLSRLFCAAIAA